MDFQNSPDFPRIGVGPARAAFDGFGLPARRPHDERIADEVGLPFTRYRLWRRMAVVMRTVSGGGAV